MINNEGFEVGADYVAAKVSFDIDSAGVTSLKELSDQLEKYRTEAEAAARGSKDFVEYLKNMTTVANQAADAQKNLIAQLNLMTSLQQTTMTNQGSAISRGVPQGYIDPFSGMGTGVGRTPGDGGSPTLAGAQNYLGNMAQQDPRQYLNWQNQRGNLRTGDVPAQSPGDQDLDQIARRHVDREEVQNRRNAKGDPYSSLSDRISSMSTGASQLVNELSPGGGVQGPMGLLQRGLGSLSGMARASGAVGTLGAVAGPAALGLGAAAAGYGIYQGVGGAIQGYREMGQIRGGGASEGIGYEMAIRSMAMNPFISTEQARQIISQGLSSGYSGKEFDTVTQFMANNLKDMNMSAAESMAVFKKNVTEGGMTSAGLGTTMAGLKELAGVPGTTMTQADITSGYASASGAMIDAGVSGASASAAAASGTQVFAGIENLKEVGSQLQASASNSEMAQGYIRQFGGYASELAGVDPGGVMEALGGDKGTNATFNTLVHFAKLFHGQAAGRKGWAVKQFQMMLRRMFPDISWERNKVQQLMTQLLQNGNPYPAAQEQSRQATTAASQIKERGAINRNFTRKIGGLGTIGSAIGDTAEGIFNMLQGKTQPDGQDAFDYADTRANMDRVDAASTASNIPLMDAIVAAEGGTRNVQVGSGDKWAAFNPNDRKQLEALRDGKMNWRPKGSNSGGQSLADTPNGQGISGGGGPNMFNNEKGGPVNIGVGGVLKIEVTGDSRNIRVPDQVRLTANQQAAQQGFGGATLNAPPPGDTPGLNGYNDLKYR
jgi:hypothetical protein